MGGYDAAEFRELQQRLLPAWPGMTLRAVESMSRAIVVVSSVSFATPPHLAPVLPSYEERYLFHVLALVRAPRTHVVYVTSQPMLPRLVDYYLGLTTGIGAATMRERLTVLAVGDSSPRPLTAKLLEHPRLLDRVRRTVAGYDHALMLPFVTTPLEVELALRLGIPVYGSAPHLHHLGTKTGSREVFAAAGVPAPRGVDGVRTPEDVARAVRAMYAERPARRFVIKTDSGGSGFGNAIVEVPDGDPATVAKAVESAALGDPDLTHDEYFATLEAGGVVEEWIEADEVCSPSVQLRASPHGEVEVLSTHDQLLGGPGGLTFLGCRFPAAPGFVPELTRLGRAVGEELARRGVIGRFGVDFVMARRGARWDPYAVEINLRNGGTTHPALTLLALTDGEYDEPTGRFLTRTGPKHYVASDHIEDPAYRALTPDDVLDVVAESGLGWDDETQTGVALHLVSAVAVAGRLGATAIGDSPGQAEQLHDRLVRCLDLATGVTAR